MSGEILLRDNGEDHEGKRVCHSGRYYVCIGMVGSTYQEMIDKGTWDG